MPRGWGEVLRGCEEGMEELGEGLHGQGSVGRTGVGRQLRTNLYGRRSCAGRQAEDQSVNLEKELPNASF